MNKTATVEVLTAEVRVLMVGSRQITLSVARQLDRVPWHRCHPFGRIRDSQSYYDKTIIGKNIDDGTLVRSELYPRPEWSSSEESQLNRWKSKVSENIQNCEYYRKLMADDHRPDQKAWYARLISDKESENEVLKTDILEQEAHKIMIPSLREAYDAELSKFKALPLIILAGLR